MKPVIFYIDDEPHNLTVFEASLPEEWEILTFDNPLVALEALEIHSPWVMVTDQRMPHITGVKYLELARKIHPHAVRIIVTGYSDEDLVIESVRKAQVFDYIRKPWDPDNLEKSLCRAIEYYKMDREKRGLVEQLESRQRELEEKNSSLEKLARELEQAKLSEEQVRKELECWVHPYILWSIRDKGIQFPVKKDIVGITFDIVKSSRLHGMTFKGHSLRAEVIRAFSECIIRNGGWRESHSGDSAFGHFGLLQNESDPFEAALAASSEFRVAIRSIGRQHGEHVECGVALHVAKDSVVDIHTVQISTPNGQVTQKSFDTTSAGIDILHRLEKLTHRLPGSNVILSGDFVSRLKNPPSNIIQLGEYRFPDHKEKHMLYIKPSDLLSTKDLEDFKTHLNLSISKTPLKVAA